MIEVDTQIDQEQARPGVENAIAVRVREVGGEVVYLPKLNAIAMALLDQHEMTFTDGALAIEKLRRRHSTNIRE